jgi:DNA polymerase-3 subunit delta'
MLVGHKKQWEFLKSKFENDQLSHAYLFKGPAGIGKKLFAKEFSEFIGCKFPDLKILSEENKKDPLFGDGGEIKISQIREVQNFLNYKSYNGSYKIVIIDDAEKMNQEAQSCFLKTLEEPKGCTVLFLISSKPDMLLETISSRCQMLKFFKPKDLPIDKEKQEIDKKILNDLIIITNSSFADRFKYVKSIDFTKQDPLEILKVFQKYFRNILLQKITGEKTSDKYSVDNLKKILNLSEEISNKLTFTNANPKLALELLLMEI